jgi:plasmid stabilization system protein ParE
MKIEFTKRAVADLRKIGANSYPFGETVTLAVETRIREVIAHIAAHPEAAAPVVERPGMRVAPLIRYPYRIFYRVLEDRVRILHIRHTSRRPWPSAGA